MTMLGSTVLGIDNVLFEVGDFDRAREYYRQVLGFSEAYAFPEKKMVGYQIGPETPGLGIAESATPRLGTLWLEVPSADDVYAELPDSATVIAPPFDIPTGRVFVIQNEWGNRLGFTDYLYRPELRRPGPGAA